MAIAVYPGTFDPLTRGHEDIVRRAASIFGRVVVGVAGSRAKGPIFTQEERMEIARECLAPYPNVEVAGFSGLLRDFVRAQNAGVIVRGLRAVADFEYEYQMAGMNQQLDEEIETVFLMADVSLQPIASKLVKEIAVYGGDIARFVSPPVCEEVMARVREQGLKGDY